MIEQNLIQNSPEWLEYRKKGIGGSDAPVIMGVSPWLTRYELWKEKLDIGERPERQNNFIFEKGHEAEKRARAIYELQTGTPVEPMVVADDEFPMLFASLDGYNAEIHLVVEFKLVGQTDWDVDAVPIKYWPQIQHQLAVSRADRLDYVMFKDDKIKIIPVYPDKAYQMELFKLEMEFWRCVIDRKPPPFCDRDYVAIENPELQDLISQWFSNKNILDLAEKKDKELKALITDGLEHNRNIFKNIKINKIIRQGNVDYTKIPQLQNVDLEQYRKKPSSYYKFSVIE